MAMGDTIDASGGKALTAGGYGLMPRRMHHWATANTAFVVQVQAMGPFDMHYVRPADDPTRPPKQ